MIVASTSSVHTTHSLILLCSSFGSFGQSVQSGRARSFGIFTVPIDDVRPMATSPLVSLDGISHSLKLQAALILLDRWTHTSPISRAITMVDARRGRRRRGGGEFLGDVCVSRGRNWWCFEVESELPSKGYQCIVFREPRHVANAKQPIVAQPSMSMVFDGTARRRSRQLFHTSH